MFVYASLLGIGLQNRLKPITISKGDYYLSRVFKITMDVLKERPKPVKDDKDPYKPVSEWLTYPSSV